MRISSCHFQLSTLFLQLANKFGKHDLFQGSHGIVFTRRVTLERLVATQACLWSKVKFCTRPEGWCSWVAKKGLGAKKVSFDTLPRPCIGRSVKVSLDSIAVSLFVNYETAMLSRSAYIHTFDVAMKIKQNDAKEISVYLKCSSPCTHTKRRKNWERFSLPLFIEGLLCWNCCSQKESCLNDHKSLGSSFEGVL